MEEDAEGEDRPKRRRMQVGETAKDDSGSAAFFALHRTVDFSALPFSWLDHSFGIGSTEQVVDEQQRLLLKDEIRSVTKQLNQVKHRLNPVAEACAVAVNQRLEGDSPDQWRSSPGSEFTEARSACNPFEVLGEGKHNGMNRHFMNRSAVKLANIDAIMDFGLIQPHGLQGDPFVFVDLCGAPGGFSEYVTMRCCDHGIRTIQGYGMSLCGTNEHGKGLKWKLSDGVWYDRGSNCSYKVCTGNDGTGDIYKWSNVLHLKEMMKHDGSSEAHLVVADGGFDAQRDSENQEALSQKLLVCEAAAAMFCLRRGGTMVLKMFGGQTSTIRAMMSDLCTLFGRILVTKPISSRPASAERYLIATHFKGLPPSWNPQDWQNSVFLITDTQVEQKAPKVTIFLDLIDRDMLLLNLKACFAILSYMESKELAAKKDESFSYHDETYEVPVERYRRKWRL